MFTNAKTSTGPHRRSPSHYSVALSPTAVAWTSAWTSAARHRCRRQRIMDVGGSASWTSAAAHHGQQQLGMDFRRPTRQRPSTLKRQQAHIDVLQTTTTSLCRRQRSHGTSAAARHGGWQRGTDVGSEAWDVGGSASWTAAAWHRCRQRGTDVGSLAWTSEGPRVNVHQC